MAERFCTRIHMKPPRFPVAKSGAICGNAAMQLPFNLQSGLPLGLPFSLPPNYELWKFDTVANWSESRRCAPLERHQLLWFALAHIPLTTWTGLLIRDFRKKCWAQFLKQLEDPI